MLQLMNQLDGLNCHQNKFEMIDPKTSKKVQIYLQNEYNESDNEAYGSPIIPDEEAKISDFFTGFYLFIYFTP